MDITILNIVSFILVGLGAYAIGRQSEQKIWARRMFELWRVEIQAIKDKIDLQTVHGEKYEVGK